MNKRLLGGLLAAGIVGGGVYGFAASLTVNPGGLGAGDELISSCDDVVGTSYTTTWNNTAKRYEVASVTVTGINEVACNNADISVTLVGSDGAQTGPAIPSSTVSGTSKTFTVGTGASAAAVEGVHVAIDA